MLIRSNIRRASDRIEPIRSGVEISNKAVATTDATRLRLDRRATVVRLCASNLNRIAVVTQL